MLRRRLMKRLSKSASDISNCKKKTYSTSPEEEEREFDHESNYGNRRGGEYDEDGDWEHRPASAASSYSSPIGLGHENADGIRSSSRSARSEGHGSRSKKHAYAEVGIRNVGDQIHSAYKANQGFLNMLKQKFLKSSSSKHVGYDSNTLPHPGKSRQRNTESNEEDNRNINEDRLLPSASGNPNATTATNSANATPEMARRRYARENEARRDSTPEVVRIRYESGSANAHVHATSDSSVKPEVIRHPPGMQPQVLFQGVETAAGVELDIPKSSNAQFPGMKGGGAEIIRVKSSIHQADGEIIKHASTSENASQKHVTSATKKCNKNNNSDVNHKAGSSSSQGMSVTKAHSSGNNDNKTSVEDKCKSGDNEGGNNNTVNSNNAHQAVGSQSLAHQPSCDSNQSSVPEDRLAELRSFPYYQLYVHLKQGHDLPAKDSCGTSDPYVKFSWKGKPVYKSKTIYKDLNPFWDEAFILTLDDPLQALELKVYDYDWGLRDDFIGEASISLVYLELDQLTERIITLVESGKSEYLGQLSMDLRLIPKSSNSDLPRVGTATSSATLASSAVAGGSNLQSDNASNPGPALDGSSIKGHLGSTHADSLSISSGASAPADKKKTKAGEKWSAIVSIVLIEGKDLLAMDIEGTSDPYCKFRIGNDRFKSKVIYETLCPRWLEQFDLNLSEDMVQELEVTVWDKDQGRKDDFMGRCSIDLSKLEHEETHDKWFELEDGAGKIHLLLTITGRRSNELLTITDLTNYRYDDERTLLSKYALRSSLNYNDMDDIGYLEIKIFSAKGLMAADLGGKSDPYTVFELDNLRRQTHIEFKTVTPVWNRVLVMSVKDVHSVLHVTVYDDDRNHRSEFLGKVGIPLLKVESGKRRWYPLKDKKSRCRAKGNNPQIQLQLTLYWNPFRAAIRTLNPKEEIYMRVSEKFKRAVFVNNVMRIKAVIMEFVNLAKFVESCLEWESPVRSTIAFISFLTITYYFQPYMFPVALLLIFIKNYIVMSYIDKSHGSSATGDELASSALADDVDDEEDVGEKEEKKTLKARLTAIQEVTAMVQNALGHVASLAERAKNTFNYSVPFLSWLAIIILVAVTLVLYFISLRFLVIVWGINKFTKKLIRPDFVPNNELLDFLSRVPDDEEILDYRELKQLNAPEESSPQKAKPGAKKKQKQN